MFGGAVGLVVEYRIVTETLRFDLHSIHCKQPWASY